MPIALTLHVLASTIWVGGMFFAWMALRPAAAALLQPPDRLRLWMAVFDRFFPWVWISVAVLLATGLWMVGAFRGGMGQVSHHILAMFFVGLIMMGIFAWIWFVPRAGLRRAVAAIAAGKRHKAINCGTMPIQNIQT